MIHLTMLSASEKMLLRAMIHWKKCLFFKHSVLKSTKKQPVTKIHMQDFYFHRSQHRSPQLIRHWKRDFDTDLFITKQYHKSLVKSSPIQVSYFSNTIKSCCVKKFEFLIRFCFFQNEIWDFSFQDINNNLFF